MLNEHISQGLVGGGHVARLIFGVHLIYVYTRLIMLITKSLQMKGRTSSSVINTPFHRNLATVFLWQYVLEQLHH